MNQDILFICGHRKSGTTMLHDLFDGHPELCTYPSDLAVFYAYYPQFIKQHCDPDVLRERLLKISIDDIENMQPAQDLSAWRKSFSQNMGEINDFQDVGQVVSALLCSFSDVYSFSKEPSWMVAKETSVEIYAQEIMEMFPNARMLHLVRDPRDNFSALKAGVEDYYSRFGEDEKITLFSLLNRLGIGLRAGKINEKKFGASRYRILKFEDLVEDLECEMRSLSQWLGIEYEDVLLKPTKFGSDTDGNNFEGKKFSTVSTDNVGAWRQRITDNEAQIIEFHMAEMMGAYGYELAFTA